MNIEDQILEAFYEWKRSGIKYDPDTIIIPRGSLYKLLNELRISVPGFGLGADGKLYYKGLEIMTSESVDKVIMALTKPK